MFFLHTSNKTEILADRLAAVIEEGSPPSLFDPEIFLIQNRGMERMLSQYLADRFGVWGNSSYLMPLQFFDLLNEKIGSPSGSDLFDRDILTWRLERLLRDLREPELGVIEKYLEGRQEELKRYQLARHLANLFDQYQIMRPDILERWENQESGADKDESWQRMLWLKLREDASGQPHRGEIIRLVTASLQDEQRASDPPFNRLFVFGVHTMAPVFLDTLNALAATIDIHFFLLSPCREYWADIESKKSRLKRLAGQKQLVLPGFGEPFFHPLLANLGQQGADFQELLLEHIDYDQKDFFVDPVEEDTTSLLHCLQRDLLSGAMDPVGKRAEKNEPDDSLLVVSCHSPMRELMVLKDHMLSWLYAEEEGERLELRDIVVMAPDIQEYAGLIPAVFKDIQHDISDCYARRENGYLDAFIHFMSLLSGRYGWSEVLALLERPEVSAGFSMTSGELELVRHWVVGSGIRWGLSSEQRREAGLFDFEPGSWRYGLKRMLMGLATGDDVEVEGILPYYDIEGSQGETLGNLCRLIEVIEKTRRQWGRPRTLSRWTQELQECSRMLFVDDERPARLELNRMLARLEQDYGPCHNEPITFEVIRQWLETEAELKTTTGFLNGRLTFCSMLPMRSIPFKVICLLGLNDGQYPKQDNFAPYDLMGRRYRRGDRSRRADDRYQFLEAILAARRRLYLSFVGQSIRTNEKIEPSVVVVELLETLKKDYAVDGIVTNHPLQPFNEVYFSGGDRFFSYQDHYCRTAEVIRESRIDGAGQEKAWIGSPVPAEGENSVTLDDLARFLARPQAYFLHNILGIDLRGQGELTDEHEPFTISGLTGYRADQDICQALLAGEETGDILTRLQKEIRWPLAGPGDYLFEQRLKDIVVFVERLKHIERGQPLAELPIELTSGRLEISGLLTNRYENGLLFYRYANLKGKDLLQAWLYHLIGAQVDPGRGPTWLVGRDRTCRIGSERGNSSDLKYLGDLFREGCRFPSSLFVEPAFSYVRQIVLNRGRGRTSPIDAARKTLTDELKNGFRPELDLLFKDQNVDLMLDGKFEELCLDFMLPLWEAVLTDTEEAGDD